MLPALLARLLENYFPPAPAVLLHASRPFTLVG